MTTMMEPSADELPATVAAKTRKRCPSCKRMIEVGEVAVLTDERWLSTKVQWGGRTYQRGAWHLWHPECAAECRRLAAGRGPG